MITLRNFSLQRGGRPLFEDVSLTVYAGWKVGLTGANGSGKSSLFSMLLGQIQPDAGDLELPLHLTIGHVAQETPALTAPAIEYVLDGDAELRRLEAALAEAEATDDGVRIGELHGRIDAVGGYAARARAGALLHGLGFAPAEHDRPVAEFSGGWRVRLNLARALMCRSDLLLLDEPTNHLDLDTVLWLEQWLKTYPGTLLLISHDRDFLDNVVDAVAHIEERRIDLYRGNYAAFERTRAAHLASRQAAYVHQQQEIAHIRSFVDRFRAKATKARQAQSRLKALERMELVAAAQVDSPFRFRFAPARKTPHPLLVLEKAAAGYGPTVILQELGLSLEPGTRIGLLGRNGVGKSTLIRLLAGILAPLAGQRTEGEGLVVGYFAQHQLEQLDPQASPLLHLQRLDPVATESGLRNFLGGFGFSGDDALRLVGPFSGGEKARLALALLAWQRPNLLLLDEPTNHLDLRMRDALTLALQEFTGALVLVSHDRHLLRSLADRFLLVTNGRVSSFDGDLDDYRAWLAQDRRTADQAVEGARPANERREQRRLEAEARQRRSIQRKPLEKRIKGLEERLAQLQEEQTRLDAELADASLYDTASGPAAKERLRTVLQRQGRIAQEITVVESDWMEVAEALEGLENWGIPAWGTQPL
ncbi:putative ATP-binding protein YheS [Gammaproteobacteria bacterium]